MMDSFTRDANSLFAEALPRLGMNTESYARFFLILNLLLPLSSSLVALIIFLKRTDDRLALLMSIALFTFSIQIGRPAIAFAVSYPELLWISTLLRVISSTLLLVVLSSFPNGRLVPSWASFYIIFGIFCVAPFTNDIRYYLQSNVTNPIALINALYACVGIGFQIWRYRYYSTSIEKQQTKWVLYGLTVIALFMTTFIVLDIFLTPSIVNDSMIRLVYRLLVNTFLIFLPASLIPVAFSIAIMRNRLWDIDIIINRSLVVIITTLVLGGIFLLVVLVIRTLFEDSYGGIPLIVAALAAGMLFNTTRQRAQRVLDRKFYRWRFDLIQLAAAERGQSDIRFGILTGKTLDGYHIDSLVGKGGMGEVYHAIKDSRPYAIKTLLENATPAHLERFKREIEAMQNLQHANIVKFFGASMTPKPYIVLEYIDGVNLETYIKQRGHFTTEDALLILRGIADALDYAHIKGVVHRDLKPANILIRAARDGISVTPLLVDFGIAKITDGTALTGTGAVGTIAYMAPEQIESARRVTHKADIYALGIIFYEMLTAKKPFEGDLANILFAHLQQPPPDVCDIRPDLPEHFNRVIQRAMAKDEGSRWQSAGEMIAALN